MSKRRCRYCRGKFEKTELLRNMPNVCKNKDCVKKFFAEYSKPFLSQVKTETQKRIRAEEREKKRRTKEKLKTHGEWLKDLQRVFNTYIRQRDVNEPCISCGEYAEKYDAGHYWSVSGYPSLRFDERNVHAQCIKCNHYLSGNIAEYTPRLVNKIGKEEFERLKSERHKEMKLTISEIKELIKLYREKLNNT